MQPAVFLCLDESIAATLFDRSHEAAVLLSNRIDGWLGCKCEETEKHNATPC
jgi:hypothetical protein